MAAPNRYESLQCDYLSAACFASPCTASVNEPWTIHLDLNWTRLAICNLGVVEPQTCHNVPTYSMRRWCRGSSIDVHLFVATGTSVISLGPGLCPEEYRKLCSAFAQSFYQCRMLANVFSCTAHMSDVPTDMLPPLTFRLS